MKKSVSVLAVLLAAGCAVSASGCAKSTKNIAALSSNWYTNTNMRDFQPTFDKSSENQNFSAEEITYNVTFEKPKENLGNMTYSVDYKEGTYTTLFYADKFDVDAFTCTECKAAYTEAAGTKGITAYYYRTELNIPTITFKCGNEERVFNNDMVITECYFLSAKNYLRPLFSRQIIKSTTPANYQASNIENTYKYVNREYENFYSYDGKAVKSLMTVYSDDYNFKDIKSDSVTAEHKIVEKVTEKLDATKNLLFDTLSLNIAVRAMNLTKDLSQTISLYSSEGAVSDFTLKGAETPLSDAEKAAITGELSKPQHGLYKAKHDENGNEIGLQTVAVNVSYVGELTGFNQTYWFVAIDNADNNTGRATMVKYSTPLAYNLGTLNYTLAEDSIKSTLWHG